MKNIILMMILLYAITPAVFPGENAAGNPANPHSWETSNAGLRLFFSGVLGQSQKQGMPTLPFNDVYGIFLDRKKNLWVMPEGCEVYRFSPSVQTQEYTLGKSITLPVKVQRSSGFSYDGEYAYLIGSDWSLIAFDPVSETAQSLFQLDDLDVHQYQAFCALPAIVDGGQPLENVASRSRFFFRINRKIIAYNAEGEKTDFTLSLPDLKNVPYGPIGFTADGKSLLAASSYPDMNAYRFSLDGAQITNIGWPAPGFFIGFSNTGHLTWGLHAGGGAKSLPVDQMHTNSRSLPQEWTHFARSVAAEEVRGRMWVGCSQGVVEYKAGGKAIRRLGGLRGVSNLAVNHEGDIVAIADNQARLLRLNWADRPDEPLSCMGNESFRPGGGWKSRACSIAWRYPDFLVLDPVEKKIWRYDPNKIGFGQKAWIDFTEANSFINPIAVTCGDSSVWVLDGGRVCFLKQEKDSGNVMIVAPDTIEDLPANPCFLAVDPTDSILLIAGTDWLWGYDIRSNSTGNVALTLKWKQAFIDVRIAGLAADQSVAIFSDSCLNELVALNLVDGKAAFHFSTGQVGIDFQPRQLVIRKSWLIVNDPSSSRLLRFHLR